MHLWYWKKTQLAVFLQRDFSKAQIQIVTQFKQIFVGQISAIRIDLADLNERSFAVDLDWYAEFRYGTWAMSQSATYNDVVSGKLRATRLAKTLTIEYTRYYYQESKKRLKIQTKFGETIRLFMIGDPMCLTVGDDDKITGPANPLFQD